MANKTCCHCGMEYSEELARRVIDEDFGPGRYDWIVNICGELCMGCAGAELYLEDEDSNEVSGS